MGSIDAADGVRSWQNGLPGMDGRLAGVVDIALAGQHNSILHVLAYREESNEIK